MGLGEGDVGLGEGTTVAPGEAAGRRVGGGGMGRGAAGGGDLAAAGTAVHGHTREGREACLSARQHAWHCPLPMAGELRRAAVAVGWVAGGPALMAAHSPVTLGCVEAATFGGGGGRFMGGGEAGGGALAAVATPAHDRIRSGRGCS